ncbi:MAG: YjdF family protein [Sphaerochaetaceae bacterium]|nr:YjdF family protein [Sphaerochaetaceae bacterium]
MGEAVVCVFTVFFEDPFWVGVSERVCDGRLETARIVFGAEPTEPEIRDFLVNHWANLRYSSPVAQEGTFVRSTVNPKRALRLVRRQLSDTISTKSQQALQNQREELAEVRKRCAQDQRQEIERQRFLERQEKKKQKKRGH